MATVEALRNNVIDKLLAISNKEYLLALDQLLEKNTRNTNAVGLSPAQVTMLKLSDEDIKAGRLISQEDLDKADLLWLKEQ